MQFNAPRAEACLVNKIIYPNASKREDLDSVLRFERFKHEVSFL